EAEPVLRQLVLVEVPRQPEASREVVRRDLDRRLADLPRRPGVALEEGDRQARHLAEDLAGDEVSGESAAEDGDVELEIVGHVRGAPGGVVEGGAWRGWARGQPSQLNHWSGCAVTNAARRSASCWAAASRSSGVGRRGT